MGSMVAGSVVAGFERTIEAHISVVFFMPIIVYLADAIGTQTEAVAVRGLSLSHTPIKNLLTGELQDGAADRIVTGYSYFPVCISYFLGYPFSMCRISCSGYCRWVRNNHRVPLALATVLYGEGPGFGERTCCYDYSGCIESSDLFSYC